MSVEFALLPLVFSQKTDESPWPGRGPNVRHQNIKLNIKAAEYGSPVEWHQDWAFYPHTNQGVLAAAVMIDVRLDPRRL